MKRWTPDSKIPKDHVICPECDQRYSFIDCRVTSNGKNRCLSCHIKWKNENKMHREKSISN